MISPRLDGHVESSGDCADIRDQLGIYLFGTIAPADRAVVVRHLAACPPCRDQLAALAALPALLRLPPVAAAAFDDPETETEPLPAPRRRRWGRLRG